MPAFAAVDVIAAKRDGHALTDAQIDWTIASYTGGEFAEEQMSALLMAILLNGMTPAEIARWTAAMVDSGTRLDLSGVGRPTVDKHSTGGVGDKISLPLAPLVAACGAAVPQLSGRGLGHTGGTLDKLESISGWRAALSPNEMVAQLSTVGAVICAASADLAPADRKLYALRDVTATVESIPMIAASIMSKKIAEGTDALVLDVKVGSGAFMKSVERADELARTMVELGAAHGVRVSALLTDMSTPLGVAVGNALEVAEAVEVLAGGGPPDVVELTLALAREMVALAGLDVDPAAVLASGAAMDSWRAMIAVQGGDPAYVLPTARERHLIVAPTGWRGLAAGRSGRRSRVLAPGCGPRQEGGCRPGRGRHPVSGQAGRPGRRGRADLRVAHRYPGAVCSRIGRSGRRRGHRGRRHCGDQDAAGHRCHPELTVRYRRALRRYWRTASGTKTTSRITTQISV